MPLIIQHKIPDSSEAFRQALYEGTVFIVPATEASLKLVAQARQELSTAFENAANLPEIHKHLSTSDILASMSKARDALKDMKSSRRFIGNITEQYGVEKSETMFDVLRLRCVPHTDEQAGKVAHSHTVHRDTWYANPECQINWWMPVFDVTEGRTFQFFPCYFDEAIENTSADFDYDRWMSEVGFGASKAHSGNLYPTSVNDPVDPEAEAFACKAGEIVIFSTSHLHQTCQNNSGLTRFSIDFRTVHIDDKLRGIGAPNVDNASTGDATTGYFNLG